jgi:hypothetical protein
VSQGHQNLGANAIDQGRWEPYRVYLAGDTVSDDAADPDDHPTPAGRFRALVDHQAGMLGPRFLEADMPGIWERIETFDLSGPQIFSRAQSRRAA